MTRTGRLGYPGSALVGLPGHAPVARRATSRAESISMVRRSAVRCGLRSPFGPVSIPEIHRQSRLCHRRRMLIEAAVQYQRRHPERGWKCRCAAGRRERQAGARPAESVPGCGAGGGWQRPKAGLGRRRRARRASGPGAADGRKRPIRSHLSHFRGPIHLMARSRLKGPRGGYITPPADSTRAG
jgi:hypothetical protein